MNRVPWSHNGFALGVVLCWTEVVELFPIGSYVNLLLWWLGCEDHCVVCWGLRSVNYWVFEVWSSVLMLADKNQVAKACLCPKWGDARDDAVYCSWRNKTINRFWIFVWFWFVFGVDVRLFCCRPRALTSFLYLMWFAGAYAQLQYVPRITREFGHQYMQLNNLFDRTLYCTNLRDNQLEYVRTQLRKPSLRSKEYKKTEASFISFIHSHVHCQAQAMTFRR